MPTSISFDLSSCMLESDANKRVIKPDKDGVYHGLCMMVLGNQPSQNGKIYDPETMADCLTNPQSAFYKRLKAGGLRGEYGHPDIRSEADLDRVPKIDMKCVSHLIVRAYTGEKTEKGNIPVYADIKPCGPYGQYLVESLESPVINTAFSLRSLVEQIGTTPEGYIRQRVLAMITWDAVDVGGYRCAAKVAPEHSVEDLSIPIKKENSHLLQNLVSMEVIDDNQLKDILQSDTIRVVNRTIVPGPNIILEGDHPVSAFHMCFNH